MHLIYIMDLCVFLHCALLLLIYLTFSEGRMRSSKSVPPGRPSLNWDNYLLLPTFADDNINTVVAAAGNNAYVHCKINHLADRAVTWIRKNDVQVLTVNTFTYTSDPRISAYSSSSGDEWVLKIVAARLDDTGGYECQVSTDPKMSMTFYLHVVVAYAEIQGHREVFMNSGGDLDLTCAVPRITNPPEFILWYNGSRVINYSSRPGVKVITSRRNKSSRLQVRRTRRTDSGNYSCVPSNARPTSVIVHILQEETPAAMQQSDNGESSLWYHHSPLGIIVFLLISLCSYATPGSLILEWTVNIFCCSESNQKSHSSIDNRNCCNISDDLSVTNENCNANL